jgi:hypothetical protein
MQSIACCSCTDRVWHYIFNLGRWEENHVQGIERQPERVRWLESKSIFIYPTKLQRWLNRRLSNWRRCPNIDLKWNPEHMTVDATYMSMIYVACLGQFYAEYCLLLMHWQGVTLHLQSLTLGRKPCTRYWKTARKSSLIESNCMWWHRNIKEMYTKYENICIRGFYYYDPSCSFFQTLCHILVSASSWEQ